MPIDPPGSVLQGLLQVGEWKFPHVAGIINAPTMRHDGSILSEPGYDAATALWHQPDKRLALPPVPNEPTADQAREALTALKSLLVGYPFVSELDRSVALCAILSAVTRGAYDVAPMFLFAAPAAGTGKSHLVDLVSLVQPGTIVVKTAERKLYLVLGDGTAIRYAVAVGKPGKQWQGKAQVSGKYVQPAWTPPATVRADNPALPDVIPGGAPNNPMGVAAMTLSGGEYAIHGTNKPESIGKFASCGCIRMRTRTSRTCSGEWTSAPTSWCCGEGQGRARGAGA